MRKVIPTIFEKDKKKFNQRLQKLVKISKDLQIDFMDGKFVKAKGIRISDLGNLKKYNVKFEAHLMVSNPEKYIKALKKLGFKKIIFHIEIKKNIDKIIELIKKQGMQVWIAVNPRTNINKVQRYVDNINGVLFMGVKPGKEKQKFIVKVYDKIKKFRVKYGNVKLQVDGGVNLIVAGKLGKIGVDNVNSGSFIFNDKNPASALRKLKENFK